MRYFFIRNSLFIFVLFGVKSLFSQSYTVSGYITDKETGEVIIGAYIYCPQTSTGASTNINGFYALTLPYGVKNIMYLHENYVAKIDTTKLNGNKLQNVALRFMDEYTTQLNPFNSNNSDLLQEKSEETNEESGNKSESDESDVDIKIKAFKNSKLVDSLIMKALQRNIKIIDRIENGFVELPGLQIAQAPSLVGEVDIIRTLKLLPGVTPGTEMTNGLYVRGGNQDQNMVLLDGMPVYNLNHIFGFYSVFNSDAVNAVDITKSGFSARQGGRISSFTDIVMKEGNANHVSGIFSKSILAWRLAVGGPISNDGKTTFFFSGRRSYWDLLTYPFMSDSAKVKYVLYDFNGKICHRFNDKSKLIFSIYSGRDRMFFQNIDRDTATNFSNTNKSKIDIRWGNFSTSLRWNKVLTKKLFSSLAAGYSQYRSQLTFDISRFRDTGSGIQQSGVFYQYHNYVRDILIMNDYDYFLNKTNIIRFGISASLKRFEPGVTEITFTRNGSGSSLFRGKEYEANASEFAAYLEDDITLNNNLKVKLGSRFVNYNYANTPKFFVEPRASFNLKVDNDYSIKGSYTFMNQNIHLLADNNIAGFTDRWVPATNRIGNQSANQFTLGISKPYKDNLELSIEGYYKKMSNVLELKEGASINITQKNWEDFVVMGKGWSYGVETFLHKRKGDVSGWISYTLSWAKRNTPGVNNGNDYYYQFDRRHYLNLVSQIKINERTALSTNVVFSTGNVQSIPSGKHLDINGNIVYEYEEKNNYRLNNTFRIDMGLTRTREHSWFEESGWNFSVYNLLARRNPAYVYIDNSGTTPKAYQRTFLMFIPGISWYTKF